MTTLTTNKASATSVSAKIAALAGTSGSSARRRRQVPTNCAGVLDKVDAMTEKLEGNLMADVSAETADILGVTLADGACSTIVEDLNNAKTRLDLVVVDTTRRMDQLQVQLLGERFISFIFRY